MCRWVAFSDVVRGGFAAMDNITLNALLPIRVARCALQNCVTRDGAFF